MATVITTIDERELDHRICEAGFHLFYGKRVRLKPGLFRASGITPKQMMKQLLEHLHCQELEWIQCEYGIKCEYIKPRQWRVMITRKPEDGSYVVQATCKG